MKVKKFGRTNRGDFSDSSEKYHSLFSHFAITAQFSGQKSTNALQGSAISAMMPGR